MNSEIKVIAPSNKFYITIGGSLVIIVIISMLLFPDVWRVGVYAIVAIGTLTVTARGVAYLLTAYHGAAMMAIERQKARNEAGYIQVSHTNYLYNVRQDSPALYPVALRQLPAGEMVIDAPPQLTSPRRNALDLLADGYHFMLVGDTGSGKTTLAANIVQRVGVANTVVCDSHAVYNRWPAGVRIVSNYDGIAEVLHKTEAVMIKRYETGSNTPLVLLAIDETPAVVDELAERGIDAGRVIRRLAREGRKAGIVLLLMSQGETVGDLGQRGHSSVKSNFVKIQMTRENMRAGFAVVKHANGDTEEVSLPAPIVSTGGQIVTPTATPRQQMTDRERRIVAAYDSGHRSLSQIAIAAGIGKGGLQSDEVKNTLSKFGRM